jgi:thiamine pyrophosphokinase
VVTAGLRFPLQDEVLHPGSSRGISNELVAPVGQVRLRSGVLLAVLPDPSTHELPRTSP